MAAPVDTPWAMHSASRSDSPSSALIFSALLGIQLLFGAGYVVSKVMVGVFPPMVWASLRISISALIMLSIALASGRPSPRGWHSFFKPLIGFALLGVVINQSSFLVGLRYTTSTNSAILNTLIPVFTLLLVILRRVEVMNWSRALGFLLALSGVLSIRHIEDFHFANQTVIGDLLTILNCLSFACFLVFGKAFTEKHDKIWTTTWLFIYGSVGITLLAIPDYANFHFPQMTPSLWFCAAFAVLGTTLLTYFLNFWALANVRSSSVALYIYLQPVVASAVSYFFLNEKVTLRTVVSAGLIFLGMIFGRAKESR